MQDEAALLLRRAEAQHEDIAQLQQRLQTGPIGWPVWWGWAGATALIALAALAVTRRDKAAATALDEDDEDERPSTRAARYAHVEPAWPANAAPAAVTVQQEAVPVEQEAAAVLHEDFAVAPAVEAAQPAPPDVSARADALLTMLGEVEFLASIGLPHGAADVLEEHLSSSASPAPLAWLELVNLHQRHADVVAATSAWTRLVDRIPAAASADMDDLLDAGGPGIEAFAPVLARVQASWDTPQAAEQLSAELMATQAPILTLAAGRDLLWLLQVCHEKATPRPAPVAEAADDVFERTVILDASDWVRHLQALEVTPRDQAASVDIDLGVPGWLEEAKASVRVNGASSATSEPAMQDGWGYEQFDAATGFERLRPAHHLEMLS